MYRNQADEMTFEYAANPLLKFGLAQKSSSAGSRTWIRRRNKLLLASSLVLATLGVTGPQAASAAPCVDTDGDGWGWDGTDTCTDVADSEPQESVRHCVDPDGDGWGWNGVDTCVNLPTAKVRTLAASTGAKQIKQAAFEPVVDEAMNQAASSVQDGDSDGFDRHDQQQAHKLDYSFFPSGGSAGGSAGSWEHDLNSDRSDTPVYKTEMGLTNFNTEIETATGAQISSADSSPSADIVSTDEFDPIGREVYIREEVVTTNDPRYGRGSHQTDEWGNQIEPTIKETRTAHVDGQTVTTIREMIFTPDGDVIYSDPLDPSLGKDEASTAVTHSLAEDLIQASDPTGTSPSFTERDLDGVIAKTVTELLEDRLASTTTRHMVMHGNEDTIDLIDVAITTNTGIVTAVDIDGVSAPQTYVDSMQRGIERSLPSPDLSGGNSLTDHDESGISAPSSADEGYTGSYDEVANLGLSGAAG